MVWVVESEIAWPWEVRAWMCVCVTGLSPLARQCNRTWAIGMRLHVQAHLIPRRVPFESRTTGSNKMTMACFARCLRPARQCASDWFNNSEEIYDRLRLPFSFHSFQRTTGCSLNFLVPWYLLYTMICLQRIRRRKVANRMQLRALHRNFADPSQTCPRLAPCRARYTPSKGSLWAPLGSRKSLPALIPSSDSRSWWKFLCKHEAPSIGHPTVAFANAHHLNKHGWKHNLLQRQITRGPRQDVFHQSMQ